VIEAFTDPDIQHWHVRRITTPQEAHSWLAQWPTRWHSEEAASWAITTAPDPTAAPAKPDNTHASGDLATATSGKPDDTATSYQPQRTRTSREPQDTAASGEANATTASGVLNDTAVGPPRSRAVGQAGLRAVNLANGIVSLSYWLLPSARGQGLATAAVAALEQWSFTLGFRRIVIEHSTQNHASCRVATTAGYPLEGTLQNAWRHTNGRHNVHLHAKTT
jgi:RimJ/RimL family protein N-acetyltransferase